MAFTPAQMIEGYIKARDRKKELDDKHKESLRPLTDFMEQLEGLLLAYLQENGMTSAACDLGTVYKRIETTVTIEDKFRFVEWIKNQPDASALDIRANKTVIRAMIDAGEETPPGV